MGRNIGGGCVGLIAYFMIATILLITFAFLLKAEGIMDVETKEPTMMFLALLAAVNGLAAYIGGAIARAIGKSPFGVYGLAVLVTGYQLFSQFREATQEQLDQLEQMGDTWFTAISYAAMNAPAMFGYIALVVTLAGFALGGLKMSDFKKTEEPDEPESPENPEQSA